MNATASAREFLDLFPATFLRLHRRESPRGAVTQQGMAVLQHLAMAGPLTITEAARHMGRAQSVMSDIVSVLERRGLLARLRDERDRRRVLVWLTPAGHEALERGRQVLCAKRTEAAFARLSPRARAALVEGMRALLRAADEAAAEERA